MPFRRWHVIINFETPAKRFRYSAAYGMTPVSSVCATESWWMTVLRVQGWTPSNKILKRNSRSLEIRDRDVGNVRMTNVNTEARSDVCILVTSEMVIGLPFNPKGLQFSVGFSVVHELWNVAAILTVCCCMYVCMYVRNSLFTWVRWFGIAAHFHSVEIFSTMHFGKVIFPTRYTKIHIRVHN
jgi:hypothetical protein